MKAILLLGISLLLSTAAAGHDLRLEPGGDGYRLLYGHREGETHGDNPTIEPPIESVLHAVWIDGEGKITPSNFSDGYPIPVGEGCAAFHVTVSSGYWTKTPGGLRNLPKNETENPLESWLSRESVKRIEKWCDRLARPLSEELEIVPLHDPFAVRKGEKLRLRVSLGGAPREGAIVLVGGRPRGETDREGRINIRVRQTGFQTITASCREPAESEKTAEIRHTAVLGFLLGENE